MAQSRPKREKAARRAGLGVLLAIVMGVVLSACVLDRGPAQSSQLTAPTPIPTFTPTPRPFSNPAPALIPETNLSQSKAEFLVWNQINNCANEVAGSTQIGIEIRFSPSFDASSRLWLIQATSGALNLNFGLWEVRDDTGTVVPLDEAASAISSREFVCSQPLALLADGLTPPTFATTK